MNENKSIFYNRNFMLLWIGKLVSNIGSNMHTIAVMWYVLEITGSPKQAGITMIFTILPKLLVSPFSGPLADRLHRKKIIVSTDLINGILVGIIAILHIGHHLDMWMLYALSAAMSATSAFFEPAVTASVPTIVHKDNLISANALSQITRYGTSILGPTIGGILIGFIGISGLFMLNSISFLLSALSESFMKIPHIHAQVSKRQTILQEFLVGVRYTISVKSLFHIVVVGGVVINFFFAPLSIFMAVYAKDYLHMSSRGYGILLSVLSLGGLTMGCIVTKISHRLGKYRLLVVGLILEGILLIPLAFVHTIPMAIFFLFLLGGAFGIVNVLFGTVIQELVPTQLMGRVSCVLNMLCTVTMPLGYYLGGLILETVNQSILYVVIGVCVALAGLSTWPLIKLDVKDSDTAEPGLAKSS